MARDSYYGYFFNPSPIPMSLRMQYKQFQAQADEWASRAAALGWRERNDEAEAAYQKRIEETKKAQ